MDFSLPVLLAAVLLSFAAATFLLKRYAKAETFYWLISFLRTHRFNASADALAKSEWIERLAVLGIILGFGAVATDFLFGRKMGAAKRAMVFLASFLLLGLSFLWAIGWTMINNPVLPWEFGVALTISFGFFGFAGFSIILLAYSAIDIISKILLGAKPCPGVAPIIPGVQFPNVPKEITPPWYIWLTFFILLFVHEFAHGVMLRRAKIRIKSFGLILLGYLPFGAFAEPDEKQLEKAKAREALKMYAAGPAANIYSVPVILLIALLYGLMVFAPFILPYAKQIEAQATTGVIVSGVDKNYSFCGTSYPNPAYGVLEKGMAVKAINGKQVSTLSDLAGAKFSQKDNNFLVDVNGAIIEKHFSFSLKDQLGLRALQFEAIKNPDYAVPLLYKIVANSANLFDSFLSWLLLLSIAIGTANFIPMPPFDGGKMVKIILAPYMKFLGMNRKETEKLIGRVFLWLMLGLILLNALPLLLI